MRMIISDLIRRIRKRVKFKLLYALCFTADVSLQLSLDGAHTLDQSAETCLLGYEAEGLVFMIPLTAQGNEEFFEIFRNFREILLCNSLKLSLVSCLVCIAQTKPERAF